MKTTEEIILEIERRIEALQEEKHTLKFFASINKKLDILESLLDWIKKEDDEK